MERKEFLKTACSLGMCSCMGVSLLAGKTLAASSDDIKKETDWRIGFMQKRFAKLIEGMNSSVNQETRTKILQDVGRFCAKENADTYIKFKDNPERFLDYVKGIWAERTEYDKKTKTMKIFSKKQESCVCPFVSKSITPKEFCDCSIGYNKEMLGVVFGQPVDAKIEESILRGGERCTFVITMK